MANINILGKDWTNIVFEDRNKSYGAYKLRQDSDKNTFLALIIGLGYDWICLCNKCFLQQL